MSQLSQNNQGSEATAGRDHEQNRQQSHADAETPLEQSPLKYLRGLNSLELLYKVLI